MSRFDHEWRVEELERSLLETRTEAAGLFSQVQTMQDQIEQLQAAVNDVLNTAARRFDLLACYDNVKLRGCEAVPLE